MQRKRRILFNTEASYTLSGFGTYTREVLQRLHSTNKYEIAELASFGTIDHPEAKKIQWTYYANAVNPNDPRHAQYTQHPSFPFGKWRFEKVLLHFKPDIVFNIRDYWMLAYEANSPFRRFFHQAWMPCVDSAPQQEEWISDFLQADGVFTYTDWAQEVLRDQSAGQIKLHGTASPGVDLNIFQPLQNKTEVRKSLGFPDNCNIIGTVMRNQKRKLFPDLFLAFRKFLDICIKRGQEELAKNTYLYAHTSYPDFGWNFPLLLKESGIAHKVLFTYICKECNHYFVGHFQDARAICPVCKKASAVMPSVTHGVSYADMAKIIGCFDVYIQYAICLGKDEQILTKGGWIPISQVELGDYAWTHKHRWRKIINKWENLPKSYGKKILKVSVHSDCDTVIATENHEFYAITKDELTCGNSRSVREALGNRLYDDRDTPVSVPYQLCELTPGDMLEFPIDDSIEDIDKIDIADFCSSSKYIITDNDVSFGVSKYKYPRFIDIDENLCKFIGIYVGDGSARVSPVSNYIRVTNHGDDIKQQESVINGMLKLKSDASTIGKRKYLDRNTIDINLNSKLHAQIFLEWCKKGADKQFPDWAIHLPPDKQKWLLSGLFMADGCYYNKNNKNVSIYNTISPILAQQVKYILRRLRINFNVCIVDKNKYNKSDNYNRQSQYRFEIRGDIINGVFDTERQSTSNVYIDNKHYMKIKDIIEVDYDDSVWNVEVEEDHTITTKIGVTNQCEGLGMAQPEAASAGVPVMAVDYSGMHDVIQKTHGMPLKVDRMFRELETGAYRAYPDNNYTAEQIYKFFNLPEDIRQRKSKQARQAAQKYYNWDNTAKTWENYFDNVELTGLQGKWNSPAQYKQVVPLTQDTEQMDNMTFINWLIGAVLQDRSQISSFLSMRLLRDLNYGAEINGQKPSPVTRQDLYNRMSERVKEYNFCESLRCGARPFIQEDYLDFASRNWTNK